MGPAPGRGGRNQVGQLILLAVVALVVYEIVHNRRISSDEVIFFCVLIPSVILHEVSHGAVALMFGDDTAKRAGRLTLNPVSHIDPIGTVILPAILVLSGHPAFGYAKPVPVNVRRLRNARNASLVVSLVGPAVNIFLAVLAAIALRGAHAVGPEKFLSLWLRVIFWIGYANVILAVFNLIPIPPLDGSAVVERLLPARWWPGYLRIRQYSLLIVLAIVFLRPSILNGLFDPALNWWQTLA
jgi:Zn-dependent protease